MTSAEVVSATDADGQYAVAEVEELGGSGLEPRRNRLRVNWSRALIYAVLPALALLLTLGAGYAKWIDSSARAAQPARVDSVHPAAEGTAALLSYRPETVEKELHAARDRLTGEFQNSYVIDHGRGNPRFEAAANLRRRAGTGLRLGVGNRKPRCGTRFRESDHHYRKRVENILDRTVVVAVHGAPAA